MIRSGAGWCDVCRFDGRKVDKLKPFMLPTLGMSCPALHDEENDDGDQVGEPGSAPASLADALPLGASKAFQKFYDSGACGSQMRIPFYLSSRERQILHHHAETCGIESKRIGKQQQNEAGVQGYQVQLRKAAKWVDLNQTKRAPLWTAAKTHDFRVAAGFKVPSAKPLNPVANVYHAPVGAQSAVSAEPAAEEGGGLAAMAMAMPAPTIAKHSSLKTVALLRGGMSLEALCKKYKLGFKKHPSLPLVQIAYIQTESNMSSPVVQECRGLILELDTWTVVSFPFRKFFNYAERQASTAGFDWATATVHEKLDGSLLTMYWYGDRWHVASSKLPAADGAFYPHEPEQASDGVDANVTFASMFWKVWRDSGYADPTPPPSGAAICCYMFELTSPDHTIIVRHEGVQLTCLGGRNLGTLEEISIADINKAGSVTQSWATPREFPELVGSLEAVVDAARTLNPVKHEGFVAIDGSGRRMKIKAPAYVALHHLGGNFDRSSGSEGDPRLRRRRLIQIARENEGSEFLAYYPGLADEYGAVQTDLAALVHYLSTCTKTNLWQEDGAKSSHLKKLVRAAAAKQVSAATVVRTAALRDVQEAMYAVPPLPDGMSVADVFAAPAHSEAADGAKVDSGDAAADDDDDGGGSGGGGDVESKRSHVNAFAGLLVDDDEEGSEDDDGVQEGEKD